MPAKQSKQEQQSITLTALKPAEGAVRERLRVGRGRATGAGKTCNRGHNGEGQRAGCSRKRGFEGGQMPGYRQMPKMTGFKRYRVPQWVEFNVGNLEHLLGNESALTYEWLKEKGFLNGPRVRGIRILGNGELKKALKIEAHHVTPSARQKIEAAGGSVTLVGAAAAQ